MERQAHRLPSELLGFWKTQETSFHSCSDTSHLNTSSASVDRLCRSSSGINGASGHPEKAQLADGEDGFNTSSGSLARQQVSSSSCGADTNSSFIGRARAQLQVSSSHDDMGASLNTSAVQRQVARWNQHNPTTGNNQSDESFITSSDPNASPSTHGTENRGMDCSAIINNQRIESTGTNSKNQVTSSSANKSTKSAGKHGNDQSTDSITVTINPVNSACTSTNGSWSMNSISNSHSMEERLDDLHAAAAEVVRNNVEDGKKDDDQDAQDSQETAPNTSSDCYNIDSPDKLHQLRCKNRQYCHTPKQLTQQYRRHATPSTVAETPSPSSNGIRVVSDDLENDEASGCLVVNHSFADRFPVELDSSPPDLDITSIHSDGASTRHHLSVGDSEIDQLNVSQDSLEHSIGHNSSFDVNRSGDTERMLARVVSAADAALSQGSPEDCYQQEGLHCGFEQPRQHMEEQYMRINYPYTPARLYAKKTGINVHSSIVTPGKPVLSQKQLEAIARGTTPRRSNQQDIPPRQERYGGMRIGEEALTSYHTKPLKSSDQQQRDRSDFTMQQAVASFDSDHDSLSLSTGGHSVYTAEESASNFLMNALLAIVGPLEEAPLDNSDDFSLFSDDGSSTIDTRGSSSFQKSHKKIVGSKLTESTERTANKSNFHGASIKEVSLAILQEWWQQELLKGIATNEECNGANEGATGNETPDLSFYLEKILSEKFQKRSNMDSKNGNLSTFTDRPFESIKREWFATVMNVTEVAHGDALCGADNLVDVQDQMKSSKGTTQPEILQTSISRFQEKTVDRSSEAPVTAFEIDLDGNPKQTSGTPKASPEVSANESSLTPPTKNLEAEALVRQPLSLHSLCSKPHCSDAASKSSAEIFSAPLLDDEISEDFDSPDNSLIQYTSSRENSLLHNSAASNSSRRATILSSEESSKGVEGISSNVSENWNTNLVSHLQAFQHSKVNTVESAKGHADTVENSIEHLDFERTSATTAASDEKEKEGSAGHEQVAATVIIASANDTKLSTENMASDGLLTNAENRCVQVKPSVAAKTEVAAAVHFDSVERNAVVQTDNSAYLTAPSNAFLPSTDASMLTNVAVIGVRTSRPLPNASLHSTDGGGSNSKLQPTESTVVKQVHDNKRRFPRIRITTLRGDGSQYKQVSSPAESPAQSPVNVPSPDHAEDSVPERGQAKETADNYLLLLEVEEQESSTAECSFIATGGDDAGNLLPSTVPQQQLRLTSPPKVQEADLTHLGSELVLQDSSTHEDIYLPGDGTDGDWQELLDAHKNVSVMNQSRLSHFGEECVLSEHSGSEVFSLDGDTAETASPNGFVSNKSPGRCGVSSSRLQQGIGLLVSQPKLETGPVATEKPERSENAGEIGATPEPPSLPPKLTRHIAESLFDMQGDSWEDFGSSSSKLFTAKKANGEDSAFPNSLPQMHQESSTKTCDHPDSVTKLDTAAFLTETERAPPEHRQKKLFPKKSKIAASYLQFASGLKPLPVHARNAGENMDIESVEKNPSSEEKLQHMPIFPLAADSGSSDGKHQNGLKKLRPSKLLASASKLNLGKARQSKISAPQDGKVDKVLSRPARINASSEKTAKDGYCASSKSDQLLNDAFLVPSDPSPQNPSESTRKTAGEGKVTGIFAALEDLNESWTEFSGFGRKMFAFGRSKPRQKQPELVSAMSVVSADIPQRNGSQWFGNIPVRGKTLGPAQAVQDAPLLRTSAGATALSTRPLLSDHTSSTTASLGSNCSQRKKTMAPSKKKLSFVTRLSADSVSVKSWGSRVKEGEDENPLLDEEGRQENAGFEPNKSSEWEDFSGSAVFDVFEPTNFAAKKKKKKTKSRTVKVGRASRLIHI